MKLLRVAILVACQVAPALGCVAPGSSSGSLSVRGWLRSESGEGLPERTIQLMLPAAYGLGGLDLVLHEPQDFGHKNESLSVTTDASGAFSFDLGRRIYHVGCWLLPPVGCFPKAPPAPFVLIQVTSFPGEYYAVETRDGEFKVFGLGGQELPLADAALTGLSAESQSSSAGGQRSTVGIIDLRFRNP